MYVSDRAWPFVHIYNTLAHAGNILFLMISGSLLLSEDYRFDIRIFYTRNFLKLAAAYLLWMILYQAVYILRLSSASSGISVDVIKNAARDIIFGNVYYHFWFLPMLMGLYLLLPILRAICHIRAALHYFVVLFFAFSILFPTILFFDFPYKDYFESIVNLFPVTLITPYAGYFVMGHWLSTMWKERELLCRRFTPPSWGIALIALSILVSVYGDIFLAKQRETLTSFTMNELFAIGPCMEAVGFFLLIHGIRLSETGRISSVLQRLAGFTFGIYMLHPLLKDDIQTLTQRLGLSVIFEIPLTTLFLFLVCMAMTYVLSHIPILRKWLLFMER